MKQICALEVLCDCRIFIKFKKKKFYKIVIRLAILYCIKNSPLSVFVLKYLVF